MYRKPAGYWDKEKVFEVAKKYKTKSEFWRGERWAYLMAKDNGWLKEMEWFKRKNLKTDPKKLERARNNYHYRVHKKLPNDETTDYYECYVADSAPIPDEDIPEWNWKKVIPMIAEDQAFAYAREMRRQWARKMNENFIIVVTAGRIIRSKLKYHCEIHQLKMDAEKKKEFEEMATIIINNKEE